MPSTKQWIKPELTVFGSVENITEQVVVTKTLGSGDSILVVVPNQAPTTVPAPGGPATGARLS